MFPQSMAQLDGVAPGQPSVFKLVLLGGGSVGKSSLALRFVKDDFKSILPTVGCKWRTPGVCPGGGGQGSHASHARGGCTPNPLPWSLALWAGSRWGPVGGPHGIRLGGGCGSGALAPGWLCEGLGGGGGPKDKPASHSACPLGKATPFCLDSVYQPGPGGGGGQRRTPSLPPRDLKRPALRGAQPWKSAKPPLSVSSAVCPPEQGDRGFPKQQVLRASPPGGRPAWREDTWFGTRALVSNLNSAMVGRLFQSPFTHSFKHSFIHTYI